MAIKPNAVTIAVFLLVFASATSAMPTEGTEYQDSEFLDEFSGYATEAWNYVSPSLEPLAELWYAQAVSNTTSLYHGSSEPSTVPTQPHIPYQDTLPDAQQNLLLTPATSHAEFGYPSPSVAQQLPYIYSQPQAFPVAHTDLSEYVPWPTQQFEALTDGHPFASTQNWVEHAYNTGERVQPASEEFAHWSDLPQRSSIENTVDLQAAAVPTTPTPTFSSFSGVQTSQQSSNSQIASRLFRCHHAGCRFTSRTFQILRHHQRYHLPMELRPHPCPRCNRRFHCPREVQRHLITHGIGQRFYCEVPSCPYATKGFGRKDHLTRHHRSKHPAPADSVLQTTDGVSSVGDTRGDRTAVHKDINDH